MELITEIDEKIYNVHNRNNKLLDKKFINNILKNFGVKYTVKNLKIWQKAFVHKSYSINRKKKFKNEDFSLPDDGYGYIPLQKESSECLEWLGDGIIQSVTAQYLWKRYPNQDEGFLTKTRSKLVRTDALARLARYLKLQNYVLLSTYMEEESNGRDNPKVLEDAFEAFIGAMVEDLGKDEFEGYKICYQFIIKLFERVIDFAELIKRDNNYKDKLMRYCHQRFKGMNPQYENIDITLDGKNKIYTEIVRDIENRDNIIGKASARSKKEAQQQAAKMALEYYKSH
tara:strand:- start:309 stop:1163 length:855 start_codon:yes stop_codon:yes gene_type:complete